MSSNQGYSVQAESPPDLHIPPSEKTVSVFLVDSGVRVGAPRELLVIPTYKGAEDIIAPAYSFLVSHPSGKRILFDLGVRKDWQSGFSPSVLQEITNPDFGITAVQSTDVPEFLVQGGIQLDEINQILWSHHHWDHVGDPTLFPTTTDLVVGQGFG
ncbi:metallo-beta-lactamase superfamily protein [Penicillium cf. viridicatum]|uniref:Metallo-beta-lactamase superfamily protein n=1 Tax=Penicillium cf. viridicatum TaxID=2972119 RepID=A0A9W9JFN1_9EURO|nr:metallo-beta-lactamase superfamily protein [Penicillium cf. viridicatum]